MSRPAPFVRNTADALTSAILVTGFVAVCALVFRSGSAADFRALWLAGEFLAEGRPDLVYPHDTGIFTMLPPAEWIDRLLSRGYSGEVYPFIYPPIWAGLAAQAMRLMTFEALMDWVVVLNPVLLVVMLIAARSLAAPYMRLWAYLGVGFVLLFLSPVGMVALHQSQPQILVACLTVVAVERAEHGSPKLAGVLLAIAAAIKLYPALYVIFWLAGGRRQAALSFALAGGGLGLLSVALIGWPLHATFLHMVGLISDTVLVTSQSFALESLVAQLCCRDQLQHIPVPVTYPALTEGQGWHVFLKPPLLSAAFDLAQLLALGGLAFLFRRAAAPSVRAALWPFAFAFLALLGPIAWSYHFLSAVAFAPMLLVRLRPLPGLMFLAAFLLLNFPMARTVIADLTEGMRLIQVAGTLSMIGLALAFLIASRPARAEPDR